MSDYDTWERAKFSDALAAKDREIAALHASRDEWTTTAVQRGLELEEVRAEIAALREDIARLRRELWDSCNTDPAKQMRARCEAIAREYAEDIPTTQIGDGMRFAAHGIASAIAALKGNGAG